MFLVVLLSCGSASPSIREAPADTAGRVNDTEVADTDVADTDVVDPDACFVSSWGVDGECMSVAACTDLGDHTSVSGYCPGADDVQCCTKSPNVADNPAVPDGWHLVHQSDVTADMTDWAVDILHDGTTFPMFSTTTRTFDALDVLARVEWHPPDFQNSVVHRGVTLYSR
jgi:hypothetical protein